MVAGIQWPCSHWRTPSASWDGYAEGEERERDFDVFTESIGKATHVANNSDYQTATVFSHLPPLTLSIPPQSP